MLLVFLALGGCRQTLYGSGIGIGGFYLGAETASAIDEAVPCTSAHEYKAARHKIETITWVDRSGIIPRLRTREVPSLGFGSICGGG